MRGEGSGGRSEGVRKWSEGGVRVSIKVPYLLSFSLQHSHLALKQGLRPSPFTHCLLYSIYIQCVYDIPPKIILLKIHFRTIT